MHTQIDNIISVSVFVMVARDALKEQHTPVANGGRATTQQLSASMLGEFSSSQAIEMVCDIRTTKSPGGSMLSSTSLRGTTPSTLSTSGEKHATSTSQFILPECQRRDYLVLRLTQGAFAINFLCYIVSFTIRIMI